MVSDYIDQRLTEWGRWARSRKWQSCCGSAEKHYLPEAGEVWQSGEEKPVPIDMLDAWEVETAWRTFLPLRERMVLRAHYVTAPNRSGGAWFLHVRRTSRQAGISAQHWGRVVTKAAKIIESRITLQVQKVSV